MSFFIPGGVEVCSLQGPPPLEAPSDAMVIMKYLVSKGKKSQHPAPTQPSLTPPQWGQGEDWNDMV